MENKKSGLMAKFLIPFLVGIILFMIPVKYDGDWTVCVKILANIIGGALGGFLPILCVAIIPISPQHRFDVGDIIVVIGKTEHIWEFEHNLE